MAVDHRSIMPSVPGLPWWGAVAVAVAATAIGFALDAGDKELTTVFAALYVIGCVAAVLAVQQSGVFTTVIQPPLILFCTVPGAYWLFHGAGFTGIKGIVINCGYPLIERFPLMLFTSATVLLIGMIRWYFGMTAQSIPAASDADDEVSDHPREPALFAKLAGMITAALNRDPAHAIEPTGSRARRTGDRPRRATAESRAEARRSGRRPTRSTATRSGASRSAARRSSETGSGPTGSRQVRPSADESLERRGDRPRRPRPTPGMEEEQLPRRRPRPPQDFDRGDPPSRSRRDPHPYAGRPAAHGGRAEGHHPAEPPEPRPRRHQAPIGTNGSATTHHPVSQVRYRKAAGDDSGAEPRRRARDPRGGDDFDAWEYDI